MNKSDNTFETNDFSLAITLICLGFPINQLDRTNRNKVGFIFNRSDALENNVRNYWSNQIKVSPKDFFNTQKELKARIYSSE